MILPKKVVADSFSTLNTHNRHRINLGSMVGEGYGWQSRASEMLRLRLRLFDSVTLRVIRGKMAQSTEHIALVTGHGARSQEPSID